MQLELIAPQESFAEFFLLLRREERARRFNPLMELDLEGARKRLREARRELSELSGLNESNHLRWFIRLADGEIAGNVSIQNFNPNMLTAEIGYHIGDAWSGRGVATAAVRAAVDRIFAETKLRRLTAFVHQGNVASCRVLEKLGFTREGLLREHYLIEGKPANEVVYGLLRSEFDASPRVSQ